MSTNSNPPSANVESSSTEVDEPQPQSINQETNQPQATNNISNELDILHTTIIGFQVCSGCLDFDMQGIDPEFAKTVNKLVEDENNKKYKYNCISTTTINDLNETILYRLIKYLNFNDILQSRHVCTKWNQLITTSEHFLSKASISATFESNNIHMISNTSTKWISAKLKYFDFESPTVLLPFSPPVSFLENIQHLEYHQCDIYWDSFKRFIFTAGSTLRHLTISKCAIISSSASSIEGGVNTNTTINEEEFGRVCNRLVSLTLIDVFDVYGLISQLKKFIELSVSHLSKLKVEFQPFNETIPDADANTFCLRLSDLIKLNSTTLRSLVLNLYCIELINVFCPIVLTSLEPFYEGMRLSTFKLTTPTNQSDPSSNDSNYSRNNSITHNVSSSFLIFLEFIKSQQKQLASLAFPHFTHLGPEELHRTQLIDCLNPSRLEKLRLPGHVYLRKNFLRVFTKLKILFIGDKCGLGYNSSFNPTKYTYDHWFGRAGITCRTIKELSVYAKLNFSSGMLFHILEKFPNLTSLELDGLSSIFNDKDLQTIIKYLNKLRILSLTGCDKMTDAGLTGIPLRLCDEMFSLSTVYTNDLAGSVHSSLKHGTFHSNPLVSKHCFACLTGLRSLKLIGSSQFTDVGLALGIQFNELKCLHLPWSERISDWGIKKVGQYNPSLESFVLSGANLSTANEFSRVVQTHKRLQRRLCRVIKIYPDPTLPTSVPSILSGILRKNSSQLDLSQNEHKEEEEAVVTSRRPTDIVTINQETMAHQVSRTEENNTQEENTNVIQIQSTPATTNLNTVMLDDIIENLVPETITLLSEELNQ